MKIDMHIHTRRYSACSLIDPFDLIEKAKERGLDGIVITEHDRLWSREEIEELREYSGKLVIMRGVEVLSYEGLHLLIYGLNEEIPPGTYEEDIIIEAHRQSAVVIPAHPYRFGAEQEGLLCSLEIDGLEIMSTNVNERTSSQAQSLRDRLDILGIAGSDAHQIELVGAYYTEFQSNPATEEELAEALKNEWDTISCVGPTF